MPAALRWDREPQKGSHNSPRSRCMANISCALHSLCGVPVDCRLSWWPRGLTDLATEKPHARALLSPWPGGQSGSAGVAKPRLLGPARARPSLGRLLPRAGPALPGPPGRAREPVQRPRFGIHAARPLPFRCTSRELLWLHLPPSTELLVSVLVFVISGALPS